MPMAPAGLAQAGDLPPGRTTADLTGVVSDLV
jgi:hypothetical protein